MLLLGSSSLYMQRGIRESLAGRFEMTHAPHWSFQECKTEFAQDFNTYIRFGSYPAAVRFATDESRWRNFILHSIVEPVLTKDILGQHPVNNPALFRQTLELAVQYPAQVISLQKLLGQLQDRGNAATIKHYLQLFEQCFLILMLQKYTGSVIQTRASSPKIVVMNPALTNAYHSQTKWAPTGLRSWHPQTLKNYEERLHPWANAQGPRRLPSLVGIQPASTARVRGRLRPALRDGGGDVSPYNWTTT